MGFARCPGQPPLSGFLQDLLRVSLVQLKYKLLRLLHGDLLTDPMGPGSRLAPSDPSVQAHSLQSQVILTDCTLVEGAKVIFLRQLDVCTPLKTLILRVELRLFEPFSSTPLLNLTFSPLFSTPCPDTSAVDGRRQPAPCNPLHARPPQTLGLVDRLYPQPG